MKISKINIIIGFCFLTILLLVSAPLITNDTGDHKTYTDNNAILFNVTATPIRAFDNSGYISIKVETNESITKTFKLNFEDKESTIKLDNNKSSTIFTNNFNIESGTNKVLEFTDNTTTNSSDVANLTLNVLFENIKLLQAQNTRNIGPTNNIQAAINNAQPGDTISLNGGTYNISGDYDINVTKANLTLKASNTGGKPIINATGKNKRVFNIVANNTTLDGLTMTGVSITNNTDCTSGVVYSGNVVNTTIKNCNISGNNINTISANVGAGVCFTNYGTVINCTIMNNTINYTSTYQCYGGGVHFQRGGMLIDCNITNNSAINSSSGTCRGGGVLFIDAQNSNIINCNIVGNTATNAGGLSIGWGNVTNCNITNNSASNTGGGAYLLSSAYVRNCTIAGNNAQNGGGVYSTIKVYNCTIVANKATNSGGGAYLYTAGALIGCNITNNSAAGTSNSAGIGGGVYLNDSSASVTNSTIMGNNATGTNGGGGVYIFNGNVSYNRIFNNTNTNTNKRGNNSYKSTNGYHDYNWWGTNNITNAGIYNSLPANNFVVLLTAKQGGDNLSSITKNLVIIFL